MFLEKGNFHYLPPHYVALEQMRNLGICATLVEEGEVVVFFALLRGGTEEVVLGVADLEIEGIKVFLLVAAVRGEDLMAGRVVFLGGGGVCSEEDS